MDDQMHRILHAFGVCDAADAHRERLIAEAKFADDTFDALLAIPAYLRRSEAGKRELAFHRARKRAADAELQRYTRNPFVALPFASVTDGRVGCVVNYDYALTLTPDGTGGYNLSQGGAFDAGYAAGTALGLGDDSLSGALALGFSFNAPGGIATT